MVTALLAIVLVLLSLGLVFYLGRLVWQAARVPVSALFERQRMDRYLAHARRGDEYLQGGELARALAEFEAAFCPHPARDRAAAQAVINHHIGLLSRLIAAADHLQGERVRLISLAKADRLFQERNVLQRRYLTLLQSGSRQRLRELERDFRANTRELRAALANLAAEITAAQRSARYQH